MKASGLLDELRWRKYHMNKSERRFFLEKDSYNRAMGKRIKAKLDWLKKRRRVE